MNFSRRVEGAPDIRSGRKPFLPFRGASERLLHIRPRGADTSRLVGDSACGFGPGDLIAGVLGFLQVGQGYFLQFLLPIFSR